MSVFLIRHGKTQGNLEGRYIGCRTDEGLCEAGAREVRERTYPAAVQVFSSPMRRCLETAALIYPRMTARIIPDFRECDFGLFEGKNYAELNGRQDYQAWIDSGGELPFPGGESKAAFSARCVGAYQALLPELEGKDTAFILHGGVIMAIMEAFARPKGQYYDFQLKNAACYRLESDGRYSGVD